MNNFKILTPKDFHTPFPEANIPQSDIYIAMILANILEDFLGKGFLWGVFASGNGAWRSFGVSVLRRN